MNAMEIVVEIDAQIARLQQAREALTGSGPIQRKAGRPAKGAAASKAIPEADPLKHPPKRRKMSAAARERISLAQKERWAKSKASAKKTRPASARKKTAAPVAKKAAKKSAPAA